MDVKHLNPMGREALGLEIRKKNKVGGPQHRIQTLMLGIWALYAAHRATHAPQNESQEHTHVDQKW